MGMNALKLGGVAVASLAAGSAIGAHTGKKIARSTFDEFKLVHQPIEPKKKKKHTFAKLLGFAAIVTGAVLFAKKTKIGQDLVKRGKEFLEPHLNNFKATDFGKKVVDFKNNAMETVKGFANTIKESEIGKKVSKFFTEQVKPVYKKVAEKVKNPFDIKINLDNIQV